MVYVALVAGVTSKILPWRLRRARERLAAEREFSRHLRDWIKRLKTTQTCRHGGDALADAPPGPQVPSDDDRPGLHRKPL